MILHDSIDKTRHIDDDDPELTSFVPCKPMAFL